MLYDVMVGAVATGVNKPTLLFLNLAVLCLWCTLAATLYFSATSTDPSMTWLAPHAAIMLGLCTVLGLLINWFILNTGVTTTEDQQKDILGSSTATEGDEPVQQIGADLAPDLREQLENLPLQSNLDLSIAGAGEFDTGGLAIQPIGSTPLGMDPLKNKVI